MTARNPPLAGPSPLADPREGFFTDAPTLDPKQPEPPLPMQYRASGGRRVFFSFAFLLLLPFAASIGPMLYQRVSTGQWSGFAGFLVIATGLAIITALVGAELVRSIRSEVSFGDTGVRLTLPAGRGPTPLFRYASHDIPYDQIAAIETRREIYGGWVAPMMLRGCRLMLKDGRVVRLGYVSEADVDPVFPYPEIAARIAAKAGITVDDTGNVWRSMPRKLLGLKAADAPRDGITADHVEALNRGHARFMIAVVVGLVLLVGVGIAMDATRGAEGRPLPNLGVKR